MLCKIIIPCEINLLCEITMICDRLTLNLTVARSATISWSLDIWLCFGMVFGPWRLVGHLPYMCGLPHLLFALYSISLLQDSIVNLSHPPAPVYMSSTPHACKALKFGSAKAREYVYSGLYSHTALVLLRFNHYLHISYSLMVFQLRINKGTHYR